MIDAVTKAEEFLDKNAAVVIPSSSSVNHSSSSVIPNLIGNLDPRVKPEDDKIRHSQLDWESLITNLKQKVNAEYINKNQSDLAKTYASQNDLKTKVTRGVLTPEHIIRTKRHPLVLEDGNIDEVLEKYKAEYKKYFDQFSKDEIMLDPNPKYAVIKDFGVVSFGKTQKEADVINDVVEHTMMAVLRADKLGGYESISLKDSFEMEYWELEQAKLKQ
jgi:rhamnose utilization protein RhaD (predicted bifunctional aldolase and dehydrogenase)